MREGLMNSKIKRMRKDRRLSIKSRDFWVNIVDFLQQYWALIENNNDTGMANVYFIHESSGVFATMEFESNEIAEKALLQNGFKKFNDPLEKYNEYITPPEAPFYMVKRSANTKVTN